MMAASNSVKMNKPNQAELRRLMKEKQKQTSKLKKIESPLAKYIDDQLTCIVCDCTIKAEPLWLAHISGRMHKQNVEALKNRNQAPKHQSHNFVRPSSPPKLNKRKLTQSSNDMVEEKRLKSGSTTYVDSTQDKKTTLSELIKTLEEDNKQLDDETPSLPDDFFDDKMEIDSGHLETNKSSTDLPEGFFDNPAIDAKVRKVEYKDPADVEWEKFQREIASVSNKSQAIIAEEEEESTVERQIEEVDEQIENWARVDLLQRKKDELEQNLRDVVMDTKSDDSSADEQDFEEFLNWRKKDSWR